jgi:hypothetical protein
VGRIGLFVVHGYCCIFFKKKNNLRCEVCDFPEVEVRVRSKMRIAMFVNRSLKSRVK